MTEEQWLTSTDPQAMLAFLRDRGKLSGRKGRLFACACCRRLWPLLSDKYSRNALKVAERYADGDVSEEKLRFAWGDARRAAQVAYRQEQETAEASAMGAVSLVCETDIGNVIRAVGLAASCEAYPEQQARLAEVQRAQAALLRDIVGNPFRLVTIPSTVAAWNGGIRKRLAEEAYQQRQLPSGQLDHVRLAVLADALEEAGLQDEDILGHLRQTGAVHVRGCGAVDLVLKGT